MDKILEKFGLIKKSEALEYVCRELGDPKKYSPLKDVEGQFFKDLSNIENIDLFLDSTMAYDLQREFALQGDQRQLSIGAFYRTAYLKAGVKKARGLRK